MAVVGYSDTENPDWVIAHHDDGDTSHVSDPDKSWRAELPKMSAGAEQEPVVDPTTGQIQPPVETPSGSGTFLPNLAADYGMGARPPAAPEPAKPPAESIPNVSAPGGPLALATSAESLAPQVINIPAGAPETTTMSESTTQGLSKESKAAVNAAYAKQDKSQAAADQASIDATTEIRNHAYNTAAANQAALQAKVDEAEREKKTKDALVSDELRRIQERNAQPIDPKAAFKQDGMGAYALLATIGTAISNIGARAEGQQGEDVLKPINDIIDRSVKLQLAQKQADFEAGRLTLAAYQSQAQETTSHLYALANQLTLAQAKVADTEEEKMGIKALAAGLQAKRDAAAVTAATATADHKSSVWKQSTKPGTPAGTMIVPPGGNDDALNQKMIEDAAARSYPGLKPEARQKQIDAFHKAYDKTRTIKAEADDFERALRALPSSGNDLPGSGVIASHLPGALISSEGVDFRQRAQKLITDYTHELGARLNPSDVEMIGKIFEGAKDKRSMLRAIGMLKGDLEHEDQDLRAEAPLLHSARRNVEARQNVGRAQRDPNREAQNRASVPHPAEAEPAGAEPEEESE